MTAKPSFGFEGLSDFQPQPQAKPTPEPAAQAIDRVGDRLGFQSREPMVRRRRRPPTEELSDHLHIRAGLAEINRFVEWCETNRYSYREGFAELVKQIS